MLFLIYVVLIMLARFCDMNVLKLCYSDRDCGRAGMTCAQMSNINCSCVSQGINLKPCSVDFREVYVERVSSVYGKLLLEKVTTYPRAEEEEEEETDPEAASDRPKKERKSEFLTGSVFGMALATFIGLCLLICLCSICCCVGVGVLFYYARNSKD